MNRPRKQLIADEAQPATHQHRQPCSDCPWRVDSLPGWLGGRTPETWLQAAHGEEPIYCHVHLGPECAGAAIYRANVCKLPRDPEVLRLPKDREAVFTSPVAFRAHHEEKP